MKILIFCSDWPFRDGIVNFINNQTDYEIIGCELIKESDLINRSLELKPDVILIDIDHYEDGDFGSIKHLHQVLPSIAVIVISSDYSEEKMISALSSGVKGFLSRTMSKTNLLSSLHALQKGELLLPRKMMNSVVSELVDLSNNNHHKETQLISKLTYRELEVLNCIKEHETNKEIATKLMISVNTVRIHVHNILKKLNVNNRRDAAKVANKIGSFV